MPANVTVSRIVTDAPVLLYRAVVALFKTAVASVPARAPVSHILDSNWQACWPVQALALFKEAVASGYLQQPPASDKIHASLSLHAMTAGVAMLTLHSWLLRLQQAVQGGQGLPATLAIACERQPGPHQPVSAQNSQLTYTASGGALSHSPR